MTIRTFFSSRRTAETKTLSSAAAGVAAPADRLPGKLTQQVLARTNAAAAPMPRTEPLSKMLSIGAAFAKRRAALEKATGKLLALADEGTARALAEFSIGGQGEVCRIGVVGQMNAGKSSLINALVEDSDLLPSDINPSTTVVTQLHFGVPGLPARGVAFQMFDEEEWQRLSSGGRTRELVERLIPNFDWHRLQSQVEAMRARSVEKFGADLAGLLGTERFYEVLTPEILRSYVSTEGHDDDKNTGHFSDITKIANIYLGLGPFDYPVIIVDTPGVNDPFLVRDEITRQSLENTDVCVVVVTARNPLSATDLDLLRTLGGLNKNRLIVFVNKIDEVGDTPSIRDAISRTVARTLQQEFPERDIPIVIGSALWGQRALKGARTPETLNWLTEGGSGDRTMSLGQDMLERSGLPGLALAVSSLMQNGLLAERLVSVTAFLRIMAHNGAAFADFAAGLVRRSVPVPSSASIEQLEPAHLPLGLAFLLIEKLSALFLEAHARTDRIVADHATNLRRTLQHVFAEIDRGERDGRSADWRVEEMTLRRTLENLSQAKLQAAAQEFQSVTDFVERNMMDACQANGVLLQVSACPLPLLDLQTSLKGLSEPVAPALAVDIEDDSPFHSRLSMARVFEAIAEKLVQNTTDSLGDAMHEQLKAMRAASLGQLEAVCRPLSLSTAQPPDLDTLEALLVRLTGRSRAFRDVELLLAEADTMR